jgi:hypothetical protein
LPHPAHEFIGASPDGICNENSSSEYVGRLVEYKAPFSRKLNHGCVPVDYLAQMQGQLEVTGMDTCDYLECSFCIETRESAQLRATCDADTHMTLTGVADAPGRRTTRTRVCIAQGILIEIPGRTGGYRYGPLNSVDDATREQELAALSDMDRVNAVVHYWVLKEYQLVTVFRNKQWFQTVLYPSLCETWAIANAFLEDTQRYEEEARTRNDSRNKRRKPRLPTMEYSFRSA